MEKEKAFFNEVEEVLHTYEETYEEGAWEEFVLTKRKNKQRQLFYWVSAAAVVLVFFSYGLFELIGNHKLEGTSMAKNSGQHKISKKNTDELSADNLKNTAKADESKSGIITQHFTKSSPKNEVIFSEKNTIVIDSTVFKNKALNEVIAYKNNDIPKIAIDGTVANQPYETTVKPNSGQQKIPQNNTSFPIKREVAGAYDSLVNRNSNIAKAKNDSRNFTYAIVVAPSLSNQKMNFGAGMEVSYKLGKNFSINSGVIYNELNAKSRGNSLSSVSQYAQNADLAVSGIEVPLGLQYQISNGIYASVGVSGMSVLSNRLQYSYQEDRVASMPSSSADGNSSQIIGVISEQKTAQAKEDLNNYIGFFTISAGKKQAFGNSNLNIGPFLKIPFNSVSTEKIKLLQAGFKLSFDF